jgi:hypothetical protein
MSLIHQRITQFALVAMCLTLAGWISLASANEESSVLVDQQPAPEVETPKLAPPANAPASEPLPPPSKPATEAKPQPSQNSVQSEAKKPFLRPAEPRRRVPATTALSVTEEPMPAPEPEIIVESPEFEVRPAPPIEYDTDGDARRMYRKSGEVNVVMIAKNPADGCHYEIPMCIPGCCVGEPRVSGGRGLLGRGVVEFCWDCGFRAEVKFRHILGDVKVEYEGD